MCNAPYVSHITLGEINKQTTYRHCCCCCCYGQRDMYQPFISFAKQFKIVIQHDLKREKSHINFNTKLFTHRHTHNGVAANKVGRAPVSVCYAYDFIQEINLSKNLLYYLITVPCLEIMCWNLSNFLR